MDENGSTGGENLEKCGGYSHVGISLGTHLVTWRPYGYIWKLLKKSITSRSMIPCLFHRFSSGLHGSTAADSAYGQNGRYASMQPKQGSLRAQDKNTNKNF
ncbi:hypothetical protein TNCV_3115891 [Trichonephila clavipes]|nr:hypothetical protein TNCV_3115891 [Trichonephila clavipes]